MSAYISGFTLGLSLILAIGSQNAFVLKQGIQRKHVLLVCTLCACSDAILISLGVAGFGEVIKRFPEIETIARYGGAVFLVFYAYQSFRSALTQTHAMGNDTQAPISAFKTALICLAFTWLNPHVYLDTVILLGSISTQYTGQQWQFGFGAVTASFVFFYSLGFGARLLAPVFKQPKAWKILEVIVGFTMLSIATSLVWF